jgi:3-hydroxyisobutyrate dehydrogenase
MKVCFIGLGHMGAPMAGNLVRAGHQVSGFDIARPDIEGVTLADRAVDAAAGRDAIITMLPDGQILRSVYTEILPAAGRNALLIDCSTVDIASAVWAHEQALTHGLRPLDAPVSGGISGAAAGTLTFMVGGGEAAFGDAREVLEAMGKRIVHCGSAGAGQAAKICNNMILGISMLAVCEAFTLGDRLGLDRQKLFDVVSTSSGSCWSMNSYCPAPGVGPQSPADKGYQPGFAAELMLKDLCLGQDAAKSVAAPTPLGAMATAVYRDFVAAGGRGRDFSAIFEAMKATSRGETR